jgi:hypothetical protein
MLILALLLAAQEGDRFIVPEELSGDDPVVVEDDKAISAVPS